MQWRKCFDHNPAFIGLTDKLAAKQWAMARVPGLAAARVVWTGRRPEDVPDAYLQSGYVIKTNHGSAQNHFPDRTALTREAFNRLFTNWLSRPYSRTQWAYQFVERRIFVEELVGGGAPLWEMTFRSHDGVVSAYYVASEQKTDREQGAFFDGNDARLPPVIGWSDAGQLPRDFVLPSFVHAAKIVAAELSIGLDYARIDLMYDGTQILFCEATIYPGGGFGVEDNAHIGPLVERGWLAAMEKSWFLTAAQPWPMSVYAHAFRSWVKHRREQLAAGD